MAMVFEVVFLTAVISLIESTWGGCVGEGWGGWWGQVGSRRRAKASTQLKMAVLYHQQVTQASTTHREGQVCC